jgi:3-hydroxyacyl-[acyl-carrier-protein] dehydratase
VATLATALASLPHGPEFRFVDKLIALEPGKSGVGEYTIPADAPFLRGHFPGDPIMPGVLLLEAAAQLAGVVAQSDPQLTPLRGLKLTALRSVKVFGAARPGDVLRLEAQIIGRLENLIQAETTASVDGRVVLEGTLTLSGEGCKL